MRQLVALLCLLVLASACAGGDTQPAGPSPVPSPVNPALTPPQSLTAPWDYGDMFVAFEMTTSIE